MAEAGHPTTQQAPLERLLTALRTRRIAPYVQGRVVLDFGCGQFFRTLRALEGKARHRVGLDVAFAGKSPFKTPDGIDVVSDMGQLATMNGPAIDCVTSLACFEHLETADMQAVDGALAHWHEVLVQIGFLDPLAPKKLMPRLQQLLNRAQPSTDELHILRGIARAVQRAGNKA